MKLYDLDGNTLLYAAAASGRANAVETLLAQGADPNFPTASGDTPLVAAVTAHRESLATATVLVERGARVSKTLADDGNVLHVIAGQRKSDRRLIRLLARDHAAAWAHNGKGFTPSQLAAQTGAGEVVAGLEETK